MINTDLLLKEFGTTRVKYNENLKYFTVDKLDKIAEFFYIATTERELIRILDFCFEFKIPYLVYGNGTKLISEGSKINGLVIRNRTSGIKIVGIKGKVGKGAIGVDEARVEIESGVSLLALNEYLEGQGLKSIEWASSLKGTIGGSILSDRILQEKAEKIKIWSGGDIEEIDSSKLRNNYIFLSTVIKFKAR